MVFGSALIVGGWEVVKWSREFYLGPAETASGNHLLKIIIFRRDFCQRNKHDTLEHVVLTRYLYVLFLWAIAVSNFRPLEPYKNLGLPLSTITFTVNNHADNHFYKYTYLFQILYRIKSVFLKYTLKIFTFKLYLNVKHHSYVF